MTVATPLSYKVLMLLTPRKCCFREVLLAHAAGVSVSAASSSAILWKQGGQRHAILTGARRAVQGRRGRWRRALECTLWPASKSGKLRAFCSSDPPHSYILSPCLPAAPAAAGGTMPPVPAVPPGPWPTGRQRAQLRARTEAQKQATPRRLDGEARCTAAHAGAQRTGSCACPPACVVALAPHRAPAPQPPASSRCTPGSHPGACWLPVPCRQTRWCRPLAAGPQPPPSVSASALGWEGRRALASALD